MQQIVLIRITDGRYVRKYVPLNEIVFNLVTISKGLERVLSFTMITLRIFNFVFIRDAALEYCSFLSVYFVSSVCARRFLRKYGQADVRIYLICKGFYGVQSSCFF